MDGRERDEKIVTFFSESHFLVLVVTHFDSKTFNSRGTEQVTDLCKLAQKRWKRELLI